MFCQIKAIRKGSKPPIWKRAYIPFNITFAQMALVLQNILEMRETDLYEFEFYQKKERLVEIQDVKSISQDFEYSYLNAPDKFVNEWLENEKWFTFRNKSFGVDEPEYRVEIEKLVNIQMRCPFVETEKAPKEDKWWNKKAAINELMAGKFSLIMVDKAPEYLVWSEIRASVAMNKRLQGYKNAVSRDGNSVKSTQLMLKELSDNIWTSSFSDKTNKLSSEITGKSEEEKRQLVEDFCKELESEIKKNVKSNLVGPSMSRNPSLEGLLKVYSKEDLKYIAEDSGYKFVATRKDKMAYELARHLLEPQTMRELLLLADSAELDVFETAIESGGFMPTDDELMLLAELIDFGYIAVYRDGFIAVPNEVKIVYEKIKSQGYREYHQKAVWLLICLQAFSLIHVVAPLEVLFDMYKQNESIKVKYDDFYKLLKSIPERYNECSDKNGIVFAKETERDSLYKDIMARQRDSVDYYIPSMKEIISYAEDEYPACEKAYADLYNFWVDRIGIDPELAADFCIVAFRLFTTNGMMSDYFDFVNEQGIEFQSDKDVERIAGILMDVNNNSRMFELKGHKPNEMPRNPLPRIAGKFPDIIPMTSLAAEMLGQNTLEKKVYPNDPCPCGSGKKYKRCCRRN